MLSDREVARIVMMRGLGYTQSDIAAELDITQGAVSYNLKQLKRRVGEEGLEPAFMKVLAAGVGIDRMKSMGLI